MNEDSNIIILEKNGVELDSTAGVPVSSLRSISSVFESKEDITAYELARILTYQGRPMFEKDWVSLGTATRHLRRLN